MALTNFPLQCIMSSYEILPFFCIQSFNFTVDLRYFLPELVDLLEELQLPFPDVDQDILFFWCQL